MNVRPDPLETPQHVDVVVERQIRVQAVDDVDIGERLRSLAGGTIAVGFAGNPLEPSSMRGGPMFEFLFGIDQLLRNEARRDRFKMVFFSPAAEPGNRRGAQAG